jgi:hypothetical protein
MSRTLLGRSLALFALWIGFSACAAPNKTTRVQEAAYELNLGTRFARMDVALNNVSPKERKDFILRHANWHHDIRIVDLDFNGMTFNPEGNAELVVVVGWHRLNEQDVRASLISQTWKNNHGSWQLIGEKLVQGDSGLFGEASTPTTAGSGAPSVAPAPQRPTQFPTKILGYSE